MAEVLVQTVLSQWPAVDAAIRRGVLATLAEVGAAVGAALSAPLEVAVRLTGDAEMRGLNRQYRGRDQTTNCLSFALEEASAAGDPCPGPLLLGDIVLALETITAEALEREIPFEHHVIHLAVHGTLHLLGYDHERSLSEANRQENQERTILTGLGIADPYG